MQTHRQNSRQTRDIIILADFVVLNVLFFVFVSFDAVCPGLVKSGMITNLSLTLNCSFVVAQYFFSNVVHKKWSTGVQVLKQVSMLSGSFLIVSYILIHVVFKYESVSAPNFMFVLSFSLLLYLSLLLSRKVEMWVLKSYRRKAHNVHHSLFIGSDMVLNPIYEYFTKDPSAGSVVDGYYADRPSPHEQRDWKYLGTFSDLERLMADESHTPICDEVYCCLDDDDERLMLSIMRYCNDHVIHFYYVPTFSSVFDHGFVQERIGETTVFTNYGEPLMQPTNKLLKRGFDVFFSFIVLLLVTPFLPLLALIIKWQSPGPLFFRQQRTGLNGSNFTCYKFRSMHVNKEADRMQATEKDPRKFAFGDFMRKSNIDELPQFWNVLKGDMSIVGPRPHMLYHTGVYRKLIDKYMVRHFVKPGITGWAQVTGFRGETKELWQMEGRVKRDIWYIENWSFWLDIVICWKTFIQMIRRDKKAY